MDQNTNNCRKSVFNDTNLKPDHHILNGSTGILRTPIGNVHSLVPPPLPLAPLAPGSTPMSYNYNYSYRNPFYGTNSMYENFNGNYSNCGNCNAHSFRGFLSNSISNVDPEFRFIQLAEASVRPTFQSIQSLVSTVSNIASMLDSTFFALRSSFRAILTVASNFGRLQNVFSEFWNSFFLLRLFVYIYQKIIYWLQISDRDPSSSAFNQAFSEAIHTTSSEQHELQLPKNRSAWPVIIFISFIFTAPYIIVKLLGTNKAQEEVSQPSKWINFVDTIALYNFEARNTNEISLNIGQYVKIAPKEIQDMFGLLNTGWAMATTDNNIVGLIPINYVKSPRQMYDEKCSEK